jgi:hypothetical protein
MKVIIMAIITTMIPLIAAAKLKYFIMISLGLGFLGLIIGKTIMLTVLALPAAIVAAYKKESYNFVRRMDQIVHHPLSTVHSDPYAGGRLLRQLNNFHEN